MRANLAALGSGALFGVGLAISGMTKPAKVVGFLDLFGAWDASLAFVMLGAVAVHFVAFRLVRGRRAPLFAARFQLPSRTDLDARLVTGAAIFGVGWGLGGFCPGPGLVSAAGGMLGALVFVAGMIAGTKLEHVAAARRAGRAAEPPAGAP
jgi:uncharacterized membrane protein YedE/YeeE